MLYSCMHLCTCCLLCTLGGKWHRFYMVCAGWEDRMGREASPRDMTVAVVVAAHWCWVTPLRKEQSLSSSRLTHYTATANLPSLHRASEGVPTIPFPPTCKGWTTGWDKGWSFLCLRWPPWAGLGPIHPLYPVRACVTSCCQPLYYCHSPVGCHPGEPMWGCMHHEWKRKVCWMWWGKSMQRVPVSEEDEYSSSMCC